ncbi:MAG: 50S ribosomal protein L10 [Chloroflexi bacterium]|nr:50S ribosomal protein L10 [Chloroflexota bacterium]
MPTPQKQKTVEELSKRLSQSQLLVLADYRGLTVADLSNLRRQLREHGVEFQVAKNTLAALAAKSVGLEGLLPLLEGPTAIAFVEGGIVAPSKVLSDYARTSKVFSIKAGLLKGRAISAEDVASLATLPPREVLLARVLGGMQAPMTGLVTVLNANLQGLVRVLDGRRAQLAGA